MALDKDKESTATATWNCQVQKQGYSLCILYYPHLQERKGQADKRQDFNRENR